MTTIYSAARNRDIGQRNRHSRRLQPIGAVTILGRLGEVKVVPPAGESLNSLFEELSRWQDQLKLSDFDEFDGPSP